MKDSKSFYKSETLVTDVLMMLINVYYFLSEFLAKKYGIFLPYMPPEYLAVADFFLGIVIGHGRLKAKTTLTK